MATLHAGPEAIHFLLSYAEDEFRVELPGCSYRQAFIRPFDPLHHFGDPLLGCMTVAWQYSFRGLVWSTGCAIRYKPDLSPEDIIEAIHRHLVLERRILRGWVRRRPGGRELAREMRRWGSFKPTA